MMVARALPAERDDPLDRVLDLIEANVEMAIDLGLEAPLRARLARLLPAPGADGFFVGAGDSPAGSRPPAPVPEAYTPLDLAAVLTVCRDLEAFKLRGAQHAAIARLKAWLVMEMGRLNASGGRRHERNPMSSSNTRFSEDVSMLTRAECMAAERTHNDQRSGLAIVALADALGVAIGCLTHLGPDAIDELISNATERIYDAAAAESAARLEQNHGK
ncbi:MAG: hypothetical protein AB7K67_01085 [Hyphomicrobiaceae bacterium]